MHVMWTVKHGLAEGILFTADVMFVVRRSGPRAEHCRVTNGTAVSYLGGSE
jgi:hypothetical protein